MTKISLKEEDCRIRHRQAENRKEERRISV
jgi:hypothetical protein